jgi:hypothetical protein
MTNKCPRCGRGISAKYRGAPHPMYLKRKVGRLASPLIRKTTCPLVVKE